MGCVVDARDCQTMSPYFLFLDNPNVPRYVITIVDLEKWNPVLKYGIFIIPHGREREWLFATPEGIPFCICCQIQRFEAYAPSNFLSLVL